MSISWRAHVRSWLHSPLFWILCAAALLRIIAITWGLPASDGWDDDGIAPRNAVAGIVLTYRPGSYYIYPPLHAFILAALTFPVTIAALFNAHSLSQPDVIASFIQPRYMTIFALVARLVSLVMSLGTIACIAKLTETIGGRRAGLFAAAATALEATQTYYAHVTNLDGPYLFWCALSLLYWARLIAERQPRHVRWAILFAAAAIATKDQAYAAFVFSAPLALLLWFALDDWPRENVGKVMRPLLLWSLAALSGLLLLDGAITNPSGFMQRLAFLTGPASRDYAFYQSNWTGWFNMLKDMGDNFPHSYPIAAASFGVLGLLLHFSRWRQDRTRWVAGLVPFLAILSFTLAFNFVALRSEERFVLPQWLFSAVYIGIAVDFLVFSRGPVLRYAALAVLVPLAAWALFECATIDASFIADPRYDAEAWLRDHVKPGQTMEIYGQNCYLPRLPDGAVMTRVDSRPLVPRNPQIHVTEVQAPFEAVESRKPQFILVPEVWIEPYLRPQSDPGPGKIWSKRQIEIFQRKGARDYFMALSAGRTVYRLVHESVYRADFWPAVHTHESLDESIEIFERVPGA